MHLKKTMSCDALGYSSKWGEKEEKWSLLLSPRVSRIHGWDSQCKHFSYEVQSHHAGGDCSSTANSQNWKSSGEWTQMGKHNVPSWAQVLRDFLREGGNVSEWGNRCCLGWNSHSFCLVTWLLQKPYDNVFSAESLVIRLAVTNATPCFSQRELMLVTSVSLQLQLWIFFFLLLKVSLNETEVVSG